MSKFMLSVALSLASVVGFAAFDHAQPLFATSPPPPARPADTSSCCYSSYDDAEYEDELELQGGNYWRTRSCSWTPTTGNCFSGLQNDDRGSLRREDRFLGELLVLAGLISLSFARIVY